MAEAHVALAADGYREMPAEMYRDWVEGVGKNGRELLRRDVSRPFDPQKEFGNSGGSPVITLSDGRFREFYESDTVVRVGRVLIDVRSGLVVGFVDRDTLTSEATLEPEITSRWLSTDPLAGKFPYISPYAAFANNPVVFVDPSGGENVIYLLASKEAKAQIDVAKVRDIANENFKNLGLNTRVVVIEDVSRFDKNSINATDRVVLMGHNTDWVYKTNEDDKNLFNVGFAREMGEKTWEGGSSNPEKSSNPSTTQGFDLHVIGIDLSGFEKSMAKLGLSVTNEEYASFLIIHGTGHNAGVNHEEVSDNPGFMIDGQEAFNLNDIGNPVDLPTLLGSENDNNKSTSEKIIKAFGNKVAKDNHVPRSSDDTPQN